MKTLVKEKQQHTFCFKMTEKGSNILRVAVMHVRDNPGELILLRMMQDGNYHPMGDLEKKAKEMNDPGLSQNNFALCIATLIREGAIEELK